MANDDGGKVMLAATTVLRGHKTRIGKIGGNITLPRAVELTTLVAGGVGLLFGVLAAAIIHPALDSFLYGGVLGAAAGYMVVNYSPLQGESLLKWLGLAVQSKRQEVKIDGKPVRLAIGVAYLTQPARGAVRITRSAVNVPSSQFDERGVQISAKNRNLPGHLDVTRRSKDIAAANRAVPDGSVPLPANEDRSLTTKSGKAAAAAAAGKGGKRKGVEVPEPTSGRLAAARAAQAAATGPELEGDVSVGWKGRSNGRSAVQDSLDPFSAPAQSLPTQAPDLLPKSKSGPKHASRAKVREAVTVPAQAGPVDSLDPFAGKPRKLPR